MSEPKKGLFDRLYGAGKEILDEINKSLVRKTKRSLQSAYDSTLKKISDAEKVISKQRENFEIYDINKIIEQRQAIRVLKEMQEEIKEEYTELFGTEMKVEDED